MLVIGLYTELGASADEIVVGGPGRGIFVHSDVEQVDTGLILGIEPSDTDPRVPRLQHDGDSMQFPVSGVEDVTRHQLCQASDRGAAEAVERRREVGRDGLGAPPLDLVTVDKVDDFALPEKRHRRRARLILAEKLPGPGRGLQILTDENRQNLIRHHRVLER